MLWTNFERFGRMLDPWREFERMNQTVDGLLGARAGEFPAVNVWADGDTAFVTSELPGVEPAGVEISVVDKTLSLRGAREQDRPSEGEAFHRRERWQGRFSRTIELPFRIDPEKVQARFNKGVLAVSLPRAEADKPRKIQVKSE